MIKHNWDYGTSHDYQEYSRGLEENAEILMLINDLCDNGLEAECKVLYEKYSNTRKARV